MRKLLINEISTVAGGTDANIIANSLEYGENKMNATVIVPPSKNGQIVYFTLQVVEDTFLNRVLHG